MVFLDEPPVRRLDRLEIRVAFELQRVERAHLVAASAAIAGPGPLVMGRLAEARGTPLLLGRAAGGFLGAEAREIVPVLFVLGGMGLAKMPAFPAVRRLGSGSVADLVATLPVA